MQIFWIGVALTLFLIALFMLMNFGHLIKFPKRKSAITNPPWLADGTVSNILICPHCGHEDAVTEAIVKCVKCKSVVLKHPAELGALPQNTCDNRSPFLGGED